MKQIEARNEAEMKQIEAVWGLRGGAWASPGGGGGNSTFGNLKNSAFRCRGVEKMKNMQFYVGESKKKECSFTSMRVHFLKQR